MPTSSSSSTSPCTSSSFSSFNDNTGRPFVCCMTNGLQQPLLFLHIYTVTRWEKEMSDKIKKISSEPWKRPYERSDVFKDGGRMERWCEKSVSFKEHSQNLTKDFKTDKNAKTTINFNLKMSTTCIYFYGQFFKACHFDEISYWLLCHVFDRTNAKGLTKKATYCKDIQNYLTIYSCFSILCSKLYST